MDVRKAAMDWARAAMASNGVFILFCGLFLSAGCALFLMARTDMARPFATPMLVAGVLPLILGGGLLCGTWKSLAGFATAYTRNA